MSKVMIGGLLDSEYEKGDVEDCVDTVNMVITGFGDSTELFTQEESAEFYEGVASAASMRARQIRSEMKA